MADANRGWSLSLREVSHRLVVIWLAPCAAPTCAGTLHPSNLIKLQRLNRVRVIVSGLGIWGTPGAYAALAQAPPDAASLCMARCAVWRTKATTEKCPPAPAPVSCMACASTANQAVLNFTACMGAWGKGSLHGCIG